MYTRQLQGLNSSFQFFTMFVSIYFLLIIPNATSLSFNYTSFLPNNIIYDRDATPPSHSYPFIQLTRNLGCESMDISCGRAKYAQEMQLWEKTSGKLTDFTTHFSFVIDSKGWKPPFYGNGFAFFLAPNSSLPNDTKVGGSMCLTRDDQILNSTAYPFVAVEFDIYSDGSYWDNWDRIPGEHVGVDINSMKSVADKTWEVEANIVKGKQNKAQISYNSSSLNLSVVYTGSRGNAAIEKHLDYIFN